MQTLLEEVYGVAREDLILFLSPLARNTAFQNRNLSRTYPSPKLLGKNQTALSYRRRIFLSHPKSA
jgi:hypothetical protein